MITLDYIVDGTDEKKIQSGCKEKDLRLINQNLISVKVFVIIGILPVNGCLYMVVF